MPQVACLGILLADVVGKTINAFPPKGTLAAVERMELHVGGCAANAGLALARLGVDAAVLGRVGRDGFGDFLLQRLRGGGVNTGGIVQGGVEATSATMVAVDAAGERTSLHYPGAHAAFRADDIHRPPIEEVEILHVAGPFLMPGFIGEPCCAGPSAGARSPCWTPSGTTRAAGWTFRSSWMAGSGWSD